MSIPTSSTIKAKPLRIGRRYSFRIKGVMLVIAVVAVWLALLRAEPAMATPVALVSGTIWLVYRGFSRWVADDPGKPLSLADRALILLGSIWLGLVIAVVVLVVVFHLWHFD